MSVISNWLRAALVALSVAALAPAADATARATPPTPATAAQPVATSKTAAADAAPAGSPEFGLLIIIGAVAFLVFVAWLFTRVGDDSSPRADNTLI